MSKEAAITTLLEYLVWAKERSPVKEGIGTIEYRFLCSGELYPADLLGDWRKSDGARLLLAQPIQLIVASQPYDDYPQELVLRFKKPLLELDDALIAGEFADLLTLLCRRLITVYTKTRTVFSSSIPTDLGLQPWMQDWPASIYHAKPVVWKSRPATILTSPSGSEVQFHDSHPRALDSAWLRHVLEQLPIWDGADAFLRASRLYSTAMAQIETEPEAAYQLLVSCTETMAGAAFRSWTPTDEEILADSGYKGFFNKAKGEGLTEDAARRLTLRAAGLREHWWILRKFVRFLVDNADWQNLKQADDLFIIPNSLKPEEDNMERLLKRIYEHRSKATHEGQRYPASASVGSSPLIPSKVTNELLSGREVFPPVSWFERVVNSAVIGYLRTALER